MTSLKNMVFIKFYELRYWYCDRCRMCSRRSIGCLQFCITNKECSCAVHIVSRRVTGCLSIVFSIVNSTHCLHRCGNSAVRTFNIVTNVRLVIRCGLIGFQLSRGRSRVYLLVVKRFYKNVLCEHARSHAV